MKDSNKNIEKDAPILFGIHKENTLNVPKGYFDTLPNELLKIANTKPVRVLNFKKWLIYTTTVAALLIFGFFGLQKTSQQKEIEAFNKTFNALTAISFEEDFMSSEFSLPMDFNDEGIELMFNELDEQ